MCMNCRLHSYVQEDGETITGMDYREGEKWGGNNEKYGLRSLYIPEGIFIHIFHTFTFEGWSWSSYNSGLTEAVIAGVNKLTLKLWHVAASHVFPAWTQCYLWPAIKCYCTEYPNGWVSGGIDLTCRGDSEATHRRALHLMRLRLKTHPSRSSEALDLFGLHGCLGSSASFTFI